MLVTRQPTPQPHPDHGPAEPYPGDQDAGGSGHHREDGAATSDHGEPVGLQARLRAAATRLPLTLGGAPSQPLDVGRATRVIQPAQRAALTVRDGGCGFPGCDRPLAWCEAHHLQHWLHGGPTNLANLALLGRAHHRQIHEGGWQLARGPDGRCTATPPHQRHHTA
ncbi:MAG TPA: HNH endonuclease signature motif containing protein [Actinomycetota bacterium]|nr:HNH endonuclease signature motif containing protein [Actinomycetota bacterium]